MNLKKGFSTCASGQQKVDDAGRQAGTLIVTDPVRTQTVIGAVGGGRTYIEHTLSGSNPTSTNRGSWTFKWIAPATATGRVTFFAAGNAANQGCCECQT
jgi:hypothetical protein